MKTTRYRYIFVLTLMTSFLFAEDIEKYEKNLILLENEAGRIKSDILRLEKNISELNSEIEINKKKSENINEEIKNILRILYFIDIEKKINSFILKDVETKNIRYGEYIRSLINKYDENLRVLQELNKEYKQKVDILNQQLNKSKLANAELSIQIEKIYKLISEKDMTIQKDIIKYKKIVSAQREEGTKKIDEVTREKSGEIKNQSKKIEPENFRIIWPVRQGDVIREFGIYYDEGMQLEKFSKGIIIKSPFLSEVYCVSNGKVLFSGWLKGFGNTVIVEHLYGFISVYSHLARAEVTKGEDIKEGDILGFVGDTGSSEGVILYFELRKNGKAIDPMNYIK